MRILTSIQPTSRNTRQADDQKYPHGPPKKWYETISEYIIVKSNYSMNHGKFRYQIIKNVFNHHSLLRDLVMKMISIVSSYQRSTVNPIYAPKIDTRSVWSMLMLPKGRRSCCTCHPQDYAPAQAGCPF